VPPVIVPVSAIPLTEGTNERPAPAPDTVDVKAIDVPVVGVPPVPVSSVIPVPVGLRGATGVQEAGVAEGAVLTAGDTGADTAKIQINVPVGSARAPTLTTAPTA
jgi:hypothetical protein